LNIELEFKKHLCYFPKRRSYQILYKINASTCILGKQIKAAFGNLDFNLYRIINYHIRCLAMSSRPDKSKKKKCQIRNPAQWVG